MRVARTHEDFRPVSPTETKRPILECLDHPTRSCPPPTHLTIFYDPVLHKRSPLMGYSTGRSTKTGTWLQGGVVR